MMKTVTASQKPGDSIEAEVKLQKEPIMPITGAMITQSF